MSTFTPATGRGASNPETEKCIKKYGSKITQDQIKQCIANSGVLVRNDNTGVIAYSPDNKSFQTCKTEMGASQINSTAFSKCVSNLEAKNKAPAPEPKSTAQTASSCDSKEGQAFAAGGKCVCRSEYEPKTENPLTCVKKVVAPPVVGQCDGKTTLKDCTCVSPETPILVSGGAQNSSSNIYGCKGAAAPPRPPDTGADCLANARHYLNQCESDATSAINKCDPEAAERDTDSPDVGQILKQIGNAAVAKGAGSGAYDACLKTALATQSGYFAIDEYKSTNCDPLVNQCKSSCESAKSYLSENSDEILNQCMNDFQSLNQSVNLTPQQTSDYKDSVVEALTDLAADIKENQSNCEVDAVSMQDKLKQTTNDFNNAAKQAQVCRCQTGSTGEDCNAIKGPAECALNPNAVGCAMSTINCNNSDSLQCRCTRNPNLAECKSTNGGPSAFANANGGFKPTTSNGASPKMSNDGFDISFDEESNLAAVSGTSGSPTSPFGSAEAGGTGGGGGAGAGAGGEGDPAAVAADGEGGLKLLLEKAKGYVGNMFGNKSFGGGNANDKKYGKDGNGKKIDPNKWKPGMLRGVAGDGSEIGPKHRDIWKQMNSQYFLQEKTFLQEK